jgi:integrase
MCLSLKALQRQSGRQFPIDRLHIPEWQLTRARKVASAELRREFIHAHGLALHAIGIAGSALVAAEPKRWQKRLKNLSKIDWSRTNAKLWEGRAMIAGRVSKLLRNASPCIQDLVRFTLNTGLRIGEIFSLRWSDVDSENNVLNILAQRPRNVGRYLSTVTPGRFWSIGR